MAVLKKIVSSEFLKQWALVALGMASGGLSVVLAIAFYFGNVDITKKPSYVWGLPVICSIISAWLAWRQERSRRVSAESQAQIANDQLQKTRTDLEASTRRVRDLEPFEKRFQGLPKLVAFRDSLSVLVEGPWCHLIFTVKNDPLTTSEEAIARDVHIFFEFLEPSGGVLDAGQGKWFFRDKPTEARAIDIRLGVRERLILASKSLTNDVCMIGGSVHVLPGRCSVNVRLRGIQVDQLFTISFTVPEGQAPIDCTDAQVVTH